MNISSSNIKPPLRVGDLGMKALTLVMLVVLSSCGRGTSVKYLNSNDMVSDVSFLADPHAENPKSLLLICGWLNKNGYNMKVYYYDGNIRAPMISNKTNDAIVGAENILTYISKEYNIKMKKVSEDMFKMWVTEDSTSEAQKLNSLGRQIQGTMDQ